MRRTLLVLLISAAVFGGAYGLAALLLPDPPDLAARQGDGRGGAAAGLTLPTPTVPGEGVGPSEGLSFRAFDPDTNRPVARFEADRYRRTGERRVELEGVRVVVAAQGGAVGRLTSPRVVARVEPPAAGGERQVDVEALALADRARLADVTIEWFASEAALADEKPTLVARIDHLVFDHDRMTLSTADATIGGRTVLGDRVPVSVRGADYDFDGRGLLVRWDAAENRPLLVRVASGNKLTIKRPPETFAARGPVAGVALASADGSAAVLPEEGGPPVPYRLTATGDLRAVQGDATLLTAESAAVILPLSGGDLGDLGEPPPEPAPKPKPAPKPAAPAGPKAEPKPAKAKVEPVVVTWAGPLTLVPAGDDAPPLVDADDRRVRLGGGVVAALDAGTVTADALDYHAAGDCLDATAADGGLVALTDSDGGRLEAPRLTFRPDAGTATAAGAGSATLPAGDGKAATELRWADGCDFTFSEGEDGTRALRDVDARGDVTAVADELRLNAERLGLTLAPPGEQGGDPSLQNVAATGEVRCEIGTGDAAQSLAAERLWLKTEAGVGGPAKVTASGGVRVARADGSSLAGDHLEADVAPADESTGGDMRLAGLTVKGDVARHRRRGPRARGRRGRAGRTRPAADRLRRRRAAGPRPRDLRRVDRDGDGPDRLARPDERDAGGAGAGRTRLRRHGRHAAGRDVDRRPARGRRPRGRGRGRAGHDRRPRGIDRGVVGRRRDAVAGRRGRRRGTGGAGGRRGG